MREAIETLTKFISSERERFQSHHNNSFAFAFSKISRYCRFLDIILERYGVASARFMENTTKTQGLVKEGNHPVTEELWRLHLEAVEITVALHLEIESYYLFAKITLDHIAHAIEFYFGQARGISLDSHDDLTKKILEFANIKNLTAPNADLINSIQTLKAEVSDYRDYEIAHEKSPRAMKGTGFSFGDNPATRIINTRLYPTDKDVQKESKSLHELTDLMNVYMQEVVSWIKTNDKSCYLERADEIRPS